MKRILMVILAIVMMVVPVSAQEAKVGVIYNVGEVKLVEIATEGEVDNYLVPLREVAEKIGATIDWDNKTKTAIVEYLGNIIEFPQNKNYFYVNRERVQKEDINKEIQRTGRYQTFTKNIIINGSLYVPSFFLGIVYGTVNYTEEGFEVCKY